MSAKTLDYYETLGLSRDATPEQIKAAYRKLAKEYHPDRNDTQKARERFQQVNEAYDVLKDPQKRKKYDRFGPDWELYEQAGASGMGGMGGAAGGASGAGGAGAGGFRFDENVHFEDLGSFFREAYGDMDGLRGARFRRSRGGAASSGSAGGASIFDGLFGEDVASPRQGQDQEAEIEITLAQALQGGPTTVQLVRPVAGEDGSIRRERKSYRVNLPKGLTNGSRIRLGGQGGAGHAGGERGDLYLKVRLRPEENFEVKGHNLRTTLRIAPWEAVLGATVPLDTPRGKVELSVPPGTGGGKTLRLRGKGLPRKEGADGDLFVTLHIAVPPKVTETERELWKKLAGTSTFRPRQGSRKD
jgi:curved DNA-binding protein